MSSPIQADREAVLAFLSHLFTDIPDAEDGQIELAWDNSKGNIINARLFDVNALEKLADFAITKNDQGKNIFIGASLRIPDAQSGGRCGEAHVYCCTGIWCDIDDGNAVLAAHKHFGAIKPTLSALTATRPHPRAQLWWRLAEPLFDYSAIRPLTSGLAALLGGDMAAANPGRLIALPGTVKRSHKPGRVPELIAVMPIEDGRPQRYAVDQIAAGLKAPASTMASSTKTAETKIDFHLGADVQGLLDAIGAGTVHDNLLRAIGSLVGRGESDETIHLIVRPYLDKGTKPRGADDVQQMIDSARRKLDKPIPKKAAIMSDLELSTIDLPEQRFVIDQILPEGLALLCGRPKAGKSFLTLNLAYSLAVGTSAMGAFPPTAGDALVVGLEDNARRLQGRMELVRQDSPAAARLFFATMWPRMDEGGVEELEAWLDAHPDTRLVVLDPWARIRPMKTMRKEASDYQADYAAIEPLQGLAEERRIALVIVHHTRKSPSVDFVDEVLGSSGLSGAADTLLILRRDRTKADATLAVTGRDVTEQEFAMSFDEGTWRVLGDAAEYRRTELQQEIIDLLTDRGPLAPKDVADELGRNRSSIRTQLSRMFDADLLHRTEDGCYAAPLSETGETVGQA